MKRNNHGSHARVGDLVEMLNPKGERTGITGLVSRVEEVPRLGDFDDTGIQRRFLHITGKYTTQCPPHLVRILSFAD